MSQVHSPDGSSKGIDCLANIIAYAAVTVYSIAELVKWALRNVKTFFKHLIYYLADVCQSGSKEFCKGAADLSATGCQIGVDSLDITSKFLKEGVVYAASMGKEEVTIASEGVHASIEFATPALELSKQVVGQVYDAFHSFAREDLKILQSGAATAENFAHQGWLFVKDELDYGIELIRSGWKETLKISGAAPSAAEELTHEIRGIIKTIASNLIEYVASGRHQLELFIEAGIPVLSDLLLLSKQAIASVISSLLEYLVSGWNEGIKLSATALEALEEASQELRSLIGSFVLTLIDIFRSNTKQVAKLVVGASESLLNVSKLCSETASHILSALTDTLKAGCYEMGKIGCSMVDTSGDRIQETARHMQRVIIPLGDVGYSSLMEIRKGVQGTGEGASDILLAFSQPAKAVCHETGDMIQSGANQLMLHSLLLKEDLPDAFHILVQDPLEDFVIPKYRWLKRKMALLQEKRRQRMKIIRAKINAKLSQIKEKLRRRLGLTSGTT